MGVCRPSEYLHLILTDSKGKGQVKVMHVSTETGHDSSDLRRRFPKNYEIYCL